MMKNFKMFSMVFPISLLLITGLNAQTLEWVIPLNERLEIVRSARIGYYVNKKLGKRYEERNIINLTCYSEEKGKSSVKGDFSVFFREKEGDVYKQLEKHLADFSISNNGRYIVEKTYLMPNLRHIPTFPAKLLAKGEEWTAPADLIFTNFSIPFMMTFNVKYKLIETMLLEGRDLAVIDYSFNMDRVFNMASAPIDFPLRIFGKNQGRMFWDIKGKKPHKMDDEYHVVFLNKVGTAGIASAEFIMNIATRNKLYQPVTPIEKESAVREIEKELPKDSGISINQDKRGLVLSLGEILFDFDSFRLKKDAEKNLEKVSELLLKKYADREVVVEGHTDNIGNRSYNQELSEQRAKSVAKYLKSKGPLDKLSYRGYGEDKPITDNTSGEGRKKNRRVEVIINLK